jgi:stearoyl-CoA desaturase (Delta-9 desaturase)
MPMDILSKAGDWSGHDSHETHHEMTRGQRAAMLLGVIGPFIGLIAAIVLLWGYGVGWLEISLMLGMYALTVLGVTVGFHRLLTHRAFETVAPVKVLLSIAGSMALQGPVIKWCAVHRRHHQLSDREGDPHSPHLHGDGVLGLIRGMFHAHVGWLFEPEPADLGRSVKDLMADKSLVFVDRLFFFWFFLGLLIPTVIGGLVSGSWWGALLGFIWGGLVRVFVMHHVTWSINSVCHVWGTRPYQSQDHSTNNLPIAIISFGEGWHNNHHAFPTSARHGLKWWQVDVSWMFIQMLRMLGLAWEVRLPSDAALAGKLKKPESADADAPATTAVPAQPDA